MNARNALMLLLLSMTFSPFCANAQEPDSHEGFRFNVVQSIPATPVKDQYKSGTCWSFAAASFVESELLRLGYDTTDISEMFFVNHAYRDKASRFVRLHGNSTFGPGGQAHDVFNVIARHGFVTETDYPGLLPGETKHIHGELDAVLKGFLDAVVKKKDDKLSQVWMDAYCGILDAYLGPLPKNAGKKQAIWSAEQFPGFVPSDYIELTSYSHHPFYEPVNLEVPDNWSQNLYYNLPLDELMEVIRTAIGNGFTVCWDGDVSDRGFSHSNGVAILPEKNTAATDGTERSRWEKLAEKERNAELYSFKQPGSEKTITQAMRQAAFDNLQATDDHLMHLTGMVKDQQGTLYFVTKNSWAASSNQSGGFLNMSESYIRLNTIAIMVHKDSLPAGTRKKLGL